MLCWTRIVELDRDKSDVDLDALDQESRVHDRRVVSHTTTATECIEVGRTSVVTSEQKILPKGPLSLAQN